MNYSNGKPNLRATSTKRSYANRGMGLEKDINVTNTNYLDNNIAVIHKKPTPIQIVKVSYPSRNKARIDEAYYKDPSTTDYNGVYKGRYIDFEAKECSSLSSFPFSSFHVHQVKHLENVIKQNAIAFVIIRLVKFDEDYLIDAKDFIKKYKDTKSKSLPFEWIRQKGNLINNTYIYPCNYIKTIDEVYKI